MKIIKIQFSLQTEQLSTCLRLPQVIPCVQAAVLLCFRVLLLRMSPENVTSLWPTIIAEMVQVFLSIEQELMTDTEEFRQVNKLKICMAHFCGFEYEIFKGDLKVLFSKKFIVRLSWATSKSSINLSSSINIYRFINMD
jgi:hypothetical protein